VLLFERSQRRGGSTKSPTPGDAATLHDSLQVPGRADDQRGMDMIGRGVGALQFGALVAAIAATNTAGAAPSAWPQAAPTRWPLPTTAHVWRRPGT